MGVVIQRPSQDAVIANLERRIRLLEQRAVSTSGGGGTGPALWWGRLAGLSTVVDAAAGGVGGVETSMVVTSWDFSTVSTEDPWLYVGLSGQCVLSDPGATAVLWMQIYDGEAIDDNLLDWSGDLGASTARQGITDVFAGIPKHSDIELRVWGSVSAGTATWSQVTLVTAQSA